MTLTAGGVKTIFSTLVLNKSIDKYVNGEHTQDIKRETTMAMLTEQELSDLGRVAAANDGRCDRCHRKLAIYKYSVNKQIVAVLRAMRAQEVASGSFEVNLTTLPLGYSILTQRTKMRLHGLIVQVKDDDKTKKASIWRITHKGYQFLGGESIPVTVIVFDNQVLGHDGGSTTISEVTGEAEFDADPITQPEAAVYHDVRQPSSPDKHTAIYRGKSPFVGELKRGEKYTITVEKLRVGWPVKLQVAGKTKDYAYKDIAAFQKDWQLINGEQS